jgi:hypothetical protein
MPKKPGLKSGEGMFTRSLKEEVDVVMAGGCVMVEFETDACETIGAAAGVGQVAVVMVMQGEVKGLFVDHPTLTLDHDLGGVSTMMIQILAVYQLDYQSPLGQLEDLPVLAVSKNM